MEDIWADAKRTRIWENVDARKFHAEIAPLGEPAVLKGAVAHWPAVRIGAQSPKALCDYIASFCTEKPAETYLGAPEIGGRFAYSDDIKAYNFKKRTIPLRALMDELLALVEDDDAPSMFAASVNVPVHLPGVLDENRMEFLDLSIEQLVSFWVGNRTRTAAHWDLPQNLACVIRGRRRFTLLPTDQIRNLYVGPLDFTIAGRPISLVDFRNPDFDRHPRFRHAIARAEIAELDAGDAVYVPSLWFHHVETLSPLGMMMNFWWRDAAPHMLSPYLTMLHALLTVRDMPAGERMAWRAMFDHFVFQTDGDPFAHLPQDVRGIWGPMTPENIAKLKAYLIKTLGG